MSLTDLAERIQCLSDKISILLNETQKLHDRLDAQERLHSKELELIRRNYD